MSNQINEQFAAQTQAGVETAVRYSEVALQGVEKLVALQLASVRSLLDDSAKQARTLLSVKDAEGFASLQKTLAQPNVDQAVALSRSVYDIVAETQAGFSAIFDEQVKQTNKQVSEAVDRALKSAPAGSEIAVQAIKTAMSSATTAYDTVSKTAKKVGSELVEAGVAAANAANTTKPAAKKATA